MSLTTHIYQFYSNLEDFYNIWGELLEKLSGTTVHGVLGVWDNIDKCWFDDAPMLLILSSGTMSIHVKCEKDLAIGWNDIMPTEKPVWFDKRQQCEELQGLQWQEDLIWKEHECVKASIGKEVAKIVPLKSATGLIGIAVDFYNGGRLIFQDAGDVIAAEYHLQMSPTKDLPVLYKAKPYFLRTE